MRRLIFLLVLMACANIKAGEGMWPLLLDSLSYNDMKARGLRLAPEEIYSVNASSLKDAVVMFGSGCTGEIISPEGLLLTNHHCGFSRIQSHSTLQNNYLVNGFWAGSKSEELPNPGLSVTFLIRMENVTNGVLEGVHDDLSATEKDSRISGNIAKIRQAAISNTHYQAEIKPFYFGREYYLFVYEVYKDVRLVGTPPEAIGNFGGDSDNWIWPRHTGDFSMFRIYAGKDNKPAEYSPDNVPYKPKRYLPISTSGVKEGDFTMILGYPAQTDQYLTSDAIDMIALKALPARIRMRTQVLNSIQTVMDKGPAYKLQYASRQKNISNAWKKWMGVVKGIESANVIERKRKNEQEFENWAGTRNDRYEDVTTQLSSTYKSYSPLYVANSLSGELLNLLEVSNLVNRTQRDFYSMLDSSTLYKKEALKKMQVMGQRFFRSSGLEIDRKDLPVLLQIYGEYVNPAYHPDFFNRIRTTHNNNYDQFVADVFAKSLFTDSVRYRKVFSKSEEKIRSAMNSDPLIGIYRDFSQVILGENERIMDSLDESLEELYRQYVSGLMAMNPEKRFYPDANFTMRLTYGKVEGYQPSDAVTYSYQSTLDGVMQKKDPEVADYKVPEELIRLYNTNDFGSYHISGDIPVCFTASNHTSGGNSGSPVLDANGNLIGINFDRNWEGTVSDYAYDPKVCRNISLDIRYVLFIIDKYADADWLLNELTIINNN